MVASAKRDRSSELTIESAVRRVSRAPATVDRIEPPRPEEWTGEHRLPLVGATTGAHRIELPDEQAVVPPRERSRRELALRSIAALCLLALAALLFFDAAWQTVSLARTGKPRWQQVPLRVVSEPAGAVVHVGRERRGHTPLSTSVPCRGRVVEVRLSLPGYETWSWTGLCPAQGPLKLRPQLQPKLR